MSARLLHTLSLLAAVGSLAIGRQADRPRLRDWGIDIGIFKPGRLNAITDVDGIRVGQVTLIRGDSIRTGVTAILPHPGNLFQDKVPAAIVVGNGFGKLIGSTQVEELGQLETPILLTNTLSVWTAANALIDYTLSLPGNERVRSVNAVVGETNDGFLNDIRGRYVTTGDALESLRRAVPGVVEEGSIGAGAGTMCFAWKGGIGTSSRKLPKTLGGSTLGVLVQTNFGGTLEIAGVPVGKELGQTLFRDELRNSGDGSCMIVLATDAPLNSSQLKRVARRALLALGKTGSSMSNGSGDYVIAFSTARAVRITASDSISTVPLLKEESLSPLFQAAVEATEEAILNSLFKATTVKGMRGRVGEALPLDRVHAVLQSYQRFK